MKAWYNKNCHEDKKFLSTVCLQRPVDGLKMTGKKVLGLLAKDIISSGSPNFRKPFWGFRGLPGRRQQPHGRYDRFRVCCCWGVPEEVISSKYSKKMLLTAWLGAFFCTLIALLFPKTTIFPWTKNFRPQSSTHSRWKAGTDGGLVCLRKYESGNASQWSMEKPTSTALKQHQ